MSASTALVLGTDAPLSLDLLIAKWLHSAYQRTHSAKTRADYAANLADFRRYLHGVAAIDLDDPREDKIATAAQAWAAGDNGAHGGSTYNTYLAAVSSFYRHAILMGARRSDGEYLSNPLRMVGRAHVDMAGRGAHPLEPAVVARAWASIDRSTPQGLRNYALLTLYFATGRRATEISRMLMSDVHQEGQVFTLTYQRLKGGKHRTDVLERAAVPSLVDWMAYRYMTWPTTPQSALWPSLSTNTTNRDRPMDYSTARRIFLDVFGVGKLHTARKTFARQSMREGASIIDLMYLLGHHNLNTTQIYVAGLETRSNPVGEQLAAALGIGG